MAKRIVVDPIPRIEGHLRIEAVLDDQNRISEAYSSGPRWRGLELILKGREPRDAWAFTQRICGVCTTVHALASVRCVEDAIDFLHRVATFVDSGGSLLIGIDLQKDPEILHMAYNDRKGITAIFNLNMLTHINQKFQADFVENLFEHHAFYNRDAGRIEMHLISKVDQDVMINGSGLHFNQGESILTEVSYKYTLDGFAQMAAQAGFEIRKVWLDSKKYFSVQYLVAKQ